jgi:hypothetical protein
MEPLAQRGFTRPPISPKQNILAIAKDEFRAKLKEVLYLVQLMPERGSSRRRRAEDVGCTRILSA